MTKAAATSADAKTREGLRSDVEAAGLACYALHSRMTARALTRAYDAAMRPVGLRIPQFGILGAVALDLDLSETALAARLGLERTTLVRNLKLLERRGWVEKAVGTPPGVRHRLTAAGREVLAAAMPAWKAAQDGIEQGLAPGEGGYAMSTLRSLRRATRR